MRRFVMLLLQTALALCVARTCVATTMTNSWAVEVRSGGKEAADALADKHGFINLGQVGNLEDVFHFLKPVQGFRGKRFIDGVPVQYTLTSRLQSEPNVGYVQQQQRRKLHKKERGYDIPTDPNWADQWSLLNTGQLAPADAGNDMNVERAWLQGLTGCGTVVAIVDDGVEHSHSDLTSNYVEALQFDFLDRDSNAFPETVEGVLESHGTEVAGQVAMEKGNDVCGVGVAYNSFITGLRLISEAVGATDVDEADALSWQSDVVDIYCNSWGPYDDGLDVAGPGMLLERVLKMGVQEGRNGSGSIYTFASGNGGSADTCAADGYCNSIYTISVGSATSNGSQSEFDESCSAKMVVSFDSDPYGNEPERAVTTTTVLDLCIGDFAGTSASAPLVTGVLSLLLEANPSLTWRDVQYLIAYTANRNNLVDGDWVTNGGGLRVSHKFGFGAIDAEAIVSRGRHWTRVPAQLSQVVVVNGGTPVNIASGNSRALTFTGESTDVVFVEHVVLTLNVQFPGVTQSDIDDYYSSYYDDYVISWLERGRVTVSLTSPSGTTSMILPRRPGDIYPNSYDDWPLLSVHFWGENPAGTWTVNVSFDAIPTGEIIVAIPRVVIYGTGRVPDAVSRVPNDCSPECDSTRGCAALGAEFCDACANVRIASTRECAVTCPAELTLRNGYCYNATQPEDVCDAAKPLRAGSPRTVQILNFWSIVVGMAAVLALTQQ